MEPDVKSCGVIVYRNHPQRSVLLMKHADRWDFPKGTVDPGESDLECAMRELWEETAITEDDIEVDPDFRFVLPYTIHLKRFNFEPKLKHLIMFLGRIDHDPDIELTEHIGYEWLPWQPPHRIQEKTIDPALESRAQYWAE